MITLQPRAATSALSRTTLIIIIVCAAVGGLVLLIILFRAIRSCRSRNAAPLPPIQPLAHHREHQLAQFEASLHPHTYDKSLLTAPRPPHSPQFGSSKTSLLGSTSSPHTSYTPTPTGEGSEELNLAPLEPESPLPGNPGFNLSTPPTSSLNISDSPTTSCTNTPPASSAPSSFARHSKSLPRLSRDDQARPHHHRPLSVASSLSRISSRRGLPHGLHSQVQIILPAPLAPGIPQTSSHQSLHDYDIPGDRMSIVDRWIPAGRDSMAFSRSQEPNAPPRTPRRISSNPNTRKASMTTGSQINHCQYPSMPDVGLQHAPPVPRVPSIYGETGGSEKDKGKRLSKSQVV